MQVKKGDCKIESFSVVLFRMFSIPFFSQSLCRLSGNASCPIVVLEDMQIEIKYS